jgi:hypothetical protein
MIVFKIATTVALIISAIIGIIAGIRDGDWQTSFVVWLASTMCVALIAAICYVLWFVM